MASNIAKRPTLQARQITQAAASRLRSASLQVRDRLGGQSKPPRRSINAPDFFYSPFELRPMGGVTQQSADQ